MLKIDESKPVQYLTGTGIWLDATLIDANFMSGNRRKSVYKMMNPNTKHEFIRYLYDYVGHEKYWRNKKNTAILGAVLLQNPKSIYRFTVSYCNKNILGGFKSYEEVVKGYDNCRVVVHFEEEVELND